MTQRKHAAAAPFRPAAPPRSSQAARRSEGPSFPEDSATFSLAALVETELARPAPTRAPQAASSGVIHLEALRGQRARPTHRLVAPDLVASRASSRASSRVIAVGRPFAQAVLLTLGMLTSGLLALVVFAWLDTAPTVAIEDRVRPAAILLLDELEPAVAETVVHVDRPVRMAPRIPRVADAPADDPTDTAEAPTTKPAPASARPRTVSRPSAPKPAAAPPKPSSPVRPSLTADCILDPSRCADGSTSRPETLTSAQIRSGLQRVEAQAKRCAVTHGASADTRVRVQLSIDGATGRVRQATPQAPHSDALGRCVATALSKATFPAFTRSSMGVIYTVSM